MSEYAFELLCDTNADMPKKYYQDNEVTYLPFPYTLGGQVHLCYTDSDLPLSEFYRRMRAGEMPSTSQINIESYMDYFEKAIQKGKDVICIVFSSGLSGSYNSACIAADEVMKKHPEGPHIFVIDSLCASMGEGLFLYYAVKARNKGLSAPEAVDYLEKLKLHVCHNFTVDDLHHLHRGGRVSKTSAVLGSMLGVKPVLHVDDEGHLIPISKVRGRKQSLIALVDNMVKQLGEYQNEIFFISHGDCIEEAEFVRDLVRQRTGIQNCMIHYVGGTIGTHSGPGTMALFFLGDHR